MNRIRLLPLYFLFLACRSKPGFTKKDLIGSWRADSVFTYTNGFVERKAVPDASENIVYAYDSLGRVTMKKGDEQRSIAYEIITGDSLVYRDANGNYLVGYTILALNPGQLVLKKSQQPMFPGPNQAVYEVRRFLPVPTRKP